MDSLGSTSNDAAYFNLTSISFGNSPSKRQSASLSPAKSESPLSEISANRGSRFFDPLPPRSPSPPVRSENAAVKSEDSWTSIDFRDHRTLWLTRSGASTGLGLVPLPLSPALSPPSTGNADVQNAATVDTNRDRVIESLEADGAVYGGTSDGCVSLGVGVIGWERSHREGAGAAMRERGIKKLARESRLKQSAGQGKGGLVAREASKTKENVRDGRARQVSPRTIWREEVF